jgi:integrase
MKLTTASIARLALPPGKADAIFWDDDVKGFGLRLRSDSAASWVYQFKFGRRTRRKTLGEVSSTSIKAARDMAADLRARVRMGEDPVETIRKEKARAGETFAASIPDYLEWQRTRKWKNGAAGVTPRWLAQIKHHLEVNAKPLHSLQFAKIDRGDVAKLITGIHRSSGSRTGNIVRNTISAFFKWAIENAQVDHNPVIGTPREQESSRSRVLIPAELRAIWKALPNDQYGAILWLLALTGQRAGEIAGLCWSEIHGDVAVLPPERTKNRSSHVVPLSNPVLEIIKAQSLRTDDKGKQRDLIFGAGGGGFSGWSKAKTRLDATIKEAIGKPLAHWTPHDLRRTFATYISGGLPAHLLEKLPPHDKKLAEGLRVQPHVREAILNHVSGYRAGVSGVYDRSTYEPEKRAALNLWADHLMAIVEDRKSNITPMRRPA